MRYLIFILLIQSVCRAQITSSLSLTLPVVALVDIEPNNTAVALSVNASPEAGDAPSVASTNSTKWINFTSAVTPSASRNLTVQVSGTLPSGINILLGTASYAGTGAGSLGTRVPSIVLSNSPQNIITNIGGAFTGNGTGNGYNLTYSLSISNFALVKQQTASSNVIFTLIDN